MRLKPFLLALLFVLGTFLPFSTQAIGHESLTKVYQNQQLIAGQRQRDPSRLGIPDITKPRPSGGKSTIQGNPSSPATPNSSVVSPPVIPPVIPIKPSTEPANTTNPVPTPSSEIQRQPEEECHVPDRTPESPDDELYCLQWNLRKYPGANVEEAWKTTKGEGVVIAVGDTGIDFEEADLDLSRFEPGWDYLQGNQIQVPSQSTDWDGHGTMSGGSLGQSTGNAYQTSGIAYKAHLMPLRLNLAPEASGVDKTDEYILNQESQIADAIGFATDNGAHVINLSIQTLNQCSPIIQKAAAQAYRKGVILVAAVGNSVGQVTYPVFKDTYYYPKECGNETVHGLIVAASNEANESGEPIVAEYSNIKWANLLAPGGSIEKHIDTTKGCIIVPAKPNAVKAIGELGIIQSLNKNNVGICQGSSQASTHGGGGSGLAASFLIKGGINHNSHVFPDLVIAIIEAAAHIARMDIAQLAASPSGYVREGYTYTKGDVKFRTPNPLDVGKAVKLADAFVSSFGSSLSADLTTKEIEEMVEMVLENNLSTIARYSKANFPTSTRVEPLDPITGKEDPTAKIEEPTNVLQFLWRGLVSIVVFLWAVLVSIILFLLRILVSIILPLWILGLLCQPFLKK
jgi:subtilisin family serine protease